jgi:hypothetical protein|nr:MAG TPA: hypothetical protein [Caudoviricetes sp.]
MGLLYRNIKEKINLKKKMMIYNLIDRVIEVCLSLGLLSVLVSIKGI